MAEPQEAPGFSGFFRGGIQSEVSICIAASVYTLFSHRFYVLQFRGSTTKGAPNSATSLPSVSVH